MTPAQRDLRDFIVDYQNANGGVTPSYDEMMAGVGSKSRGRVFDNIRALEEQGLIRCPAGRVRWIEVLPHRSLLGCYSTDDLLAELHSRNALARAA